MTKIQYFVLSALLIGGVVLGGIAGSCLFSPQPASAQENPETISSTLYSVVDADGNIKVQLGVDDDGQPLLALFDKNGNRREVMSLTTDGTPMFIMIDSSNTPRMVFGVDNDTGGQIQMYNADKEVVWSAVK